MKAYKEKIIDILMISGGEIKFKNKFHFESRSRGYHNVYRIYLTDPDFPRIRINYGTKINRGYNFLPWYINAWEDLYNHIVNKENWEE